MELTYRQEGDYLIPNLIPPESPQVGKYGMLRHRFLREHREITFTNMLISETLNRHLEEVDQQAEEMLANLIRKMAKEQGVTEELKATDQMKWVGMMNNIHAAAEEIVLNELIYV